MKTLYAALIGVMVLLMVVPLEAGGNQILPKLGQTNQQSRAF